AVGVNSGAKRELSGEDALGSLANEQLIALSKLEVPLRPHRQSVSLNCHVDRAGIGARQVEVDDELVTTAIGVHRTAAGASSSGDDLLGQLVKLSKGIKIERHLCLSRSGVAGCRLRGGYSASAALRRDVARDDGQTEGVLVLSRGVVEFACAAQRAGRSGSRTRRPLLHRPGAGGEPAVDPDGQGPGGPRPFTAERCGLRGHGRPFEGQESAPERSGGYSPIERL